MNYAKPRNDINRWLMEDQNPDARFTTMFDLHSLPNDFPGYADAARTSGPYYYNDGWCDRALGSPFPDIGQLARQLPSRPFPSAISTHEAPNLMKRRCNIMSASGFLRTPWARIFLIRGLFLISSFHELEALLLADPQKLDSQYHEQGFAIQRLVYMADQFGSPELINDGADTAPSKRITAEIPEYARAKASAGPVVAERIGLPTLRLKCAHFGEWLGRLEALRE